MNILAISGSNRADSFNTKLLKELSGLAPEGVNITQLDYASLPLFSQDLETPFPEEATRIKNEIRAADGLIVITPEYNRTMPAALVNLLDWTSRPYADSAWTGKRTYVMGVTPSTTGTTLAQADARKVLGYIGAQLMVHPEVYISFAAQKFDEQGVLTDAETREHLTKGLAAFVAFVNEGK